MKHIKLFEEDFMPAEPGYDNPIFKIRFRELDALDNKKPNDTRKKIDLEPWDEMKPGDEVQGEGEKDHHKHAGTISRIEKDDDGEVTGIIIEEDGIEISLVLSTVKYLPGGEKGHHHETAPAPSQQTMQNVDQDTFQPFSYESKNIQSFDDFV